MEQNEWMDSGGELAICDRTVGEWERSRNEEDKKGRGRREEKNKRRRSSRRREGEKRKGKTGKGEEEEQREQEQRASFFYKFTHVFPNFLLVSFTTIRMGEKMAGGRGGVGEASKKRIQKEMVE